MLDFLHIGVTDIIDILLVALLIYYVFRLIKGTSAMNIFAAIIALYVLWIILRALNMKLTSSILGQVLGVGVVALIVIFQPEIRRFLLHLGTSYFLMDKGQSLFKRLGKREQTSTISPDALEEITSACHEMSDVKTGALIVLRHGSDLDDFMETGDTIDAAINKRLIENIFFKNSPLHDGALIISDKRMLAARCTLPISNNPNIPASLGMRHRAAVGITEATDADAVVVSEQTGDIHFVANGELKMIGSITELRLLIQDCYSR